MSEFEEWRPIEWADGFYEVSSLGRVRSYRMRGRTTRAEVPRIMAMGISKRGYRSVRIRFGRDALHYVHRLVCEAFHGPAPDGKNDCRHLDGDELNNLATNLAWGSRAENCADARRHGTHHHGETHRSAKLTERDVMSIRRAVAAGEKQIDVGARFGINGATVNQVVRGERWKHLPLVPYEPWRCTAPPRAVLARGS